MLEVATAEDACATGAGAGEAASEADGEMGKDRGDRAAGDMWRGDGTTTLAGSANMAAAAAARK